MAAPRNLVNLKDVCKGYGSRSVLRDITLGVSRRATGSASSAATATASRRCCG